MGYVTIYYVDIYFKLEERHLEYELNMLQSDIIYGDCGLDPYLECDYEVAVKIDERLQAHAAKLAKALAEDRI